MFFMLGTYFNRSIVLESSIKSSVLSLDTLTISLCSTVAKQEKDKGAQSWREKSVGSLPAEYGLLLYKWQHVLQNLINKFCCG